MSICAYTFLSMNERGKMKRKIILSAISVCMMFSFIPAISAEVKESDLLRENIVSPQAGFSAAASGLLDEFVNDMNSIDDSTDSNKKVHIR